MLNGSFTTLNGETSSFKIDDPTSDTVPDWTTTPGTPAATNILTCLVYQSATTNMCGTLPVGESAIP